MLTNRVRLVVLSCVLALAPVLLRSTSAIAAGQPMRKDSGMLFQQRVEAYVALHRQCVQRLSLKGVDPNARGGATFRQALADSIRSARRDALPGDIFCRAVAPRILHLIGTDLAAREPMDRQAILAETPCALPLHVNDQYPIGQPFVTMPPMLLLRLPPLPTEVQYRFMGRTLILVDVEARLVVDLLQDALRFP
jgi:hypothetical protein